MTSILAIGIGAGLVSALLLGAIVSGSFLAVFLSYLAPLPLLVAGIGWGYRTALTGALAAALGLAVIVSPQTTLLYLISVGAPAAFVSYLVLLARPPEAAPDAPASTEPALAEWYPAGRIVFWLAVLGIAASLAALVRLSGDMGGYISTMRAFVENQFPQTGPSPFVLPEGTTRERILDFVVLSFPASMATMFMLSHTANLWLADRIARRISAYPRPALGLGQLSLPAEAGYVLIVSVIGALVLSGMAAIVALMVGVTIAFAFALSGLGLIHLLTRRSGMRMLILSSLYTLLVVLPWIILPVILLGLADTFGNVRERIAAKAADPSTSTF